MSTLNKYAYGYQNNNLAAAVNGGTVVKDTSATMNTDLNVFKVSTIGLGGHTQKFSGHIRRIYIYPKHLKETELQRLTTL